jgi:hypothetical protein
MAGNTSSARAPRGLRAFYSDVMAAFEQIPLQMRSEVAKAFTERWREYTVENRPEWRAAAKGGTSATAATRAGRTSTRTSAVKGTRRATTKATRSTKMKANGTRRLSTTGRGPGRPRNITTQQSTETISPASESAD